MIETPKNGNAKQEQKPRKKKDKKHLFDSIPQKVSIFKTNKNYC